MGNELGSGNRFRERGKPTRVYEAPLYSLDGLREDSVRPPRPGYRFLDSLSLGSNSKVLQISGISIRWSPTRQLPLNADLGPSSMRCDFAFSESPHPHHGGALHGGGGQRSRLRSQCWDRSSDSRIFADSLGWRRSGENLASFANSSSLVDWIHYRSEALAHPHSVYSV